MNFEIYLGIVVQLHKSSENEKQNIHQHLRNKDVNFFVIELRFTPPLRINTTLSEYHTLIHCVDDLNVDVKYQPKKTKLIISFGK